VKNPNKNRKRPKRKIENRVPGEVVYLGSKQLSTKLEIIDYSESHYAVHHTEDVKEAFKYKDTDKISWINVNGLNNTREIEEIGTHYSIHSLVLEDIVSPNQRPKLDEFDDYLFLTFKMIHYSADDQLIIEHVSLILGKDYLLSFQEADGDVFDSIRERLQQDRGRIRKVGADYLAYALMDAVVDTYFHVNEVLGDKLMELEEELFTADDNSLITREIQKLKKEVLRVRKAFLPLREVINRFERTENSLIADRTRSYIRDLYDHIIQVSESIELMREMTLGLMDMHMTNISNRMNQVMKVLTVMASIFIPLTFMAGIYGMNFKYMPELEYRYSYYIFLGVLLLVFLGMIWYFRRKKWF
jgi:magnesium transporter